MALTAIFGGTFNPLHIGHYEMLSALQMDESIEKILLMPDRIPPHKVCDFLAPDEDRIEMCRLVVSDFSKAELCLTEFKRQGKSYTYDTILDLKTENPDTEFTFVCGGDMLVFFDKWNRYQELLKLIPFIVFKRSDTDINLFNRKVIEFSELGMKITVKEEIIPAVSSTYIRNNIDNAVGLVPDKVYSYLKNRGIYNES